MKRRDFIISLLAGATLDRDKLLWEPGKRLISIPTPVFKVPWSKDDWKGYAQYCHRSDADFYAAEDRFLILARRARLR